MPRNTGQLIEEARSLGYDHFYIDFANHSILEVEVVFNPDAGPNAKQRVAGTGSTLDNALKAAITLARVAQG